VQGQLGSLLFLIVLVGIFYFMLIRPQKRRMEQHRSLIDSVDVGDEIVTIGGLFGTVTNLSDDEFEIEVAPGVRLRFVKSAIARKVEDEEEYVDDEEEEEEEEVADEEEQLEES
jgi:preprotein translocase subunit YajC